jgi:hypothetical protein
MSPKYLCDIPCSAMLLSMLYSLRSLLDCVLAFSKISYFLWVLHFLPLDSLFCPHDLVSRYIYSSRAKRKEQEAREHARKSKTTHNESIIASIIHYMYAKSWCDTIINEERCECGIILLWYHIIARQSRKVSDRYILYTYLHWDSIK